MVDASDLKFDSLHVSGSSSLPTPIRILVNIANIINKLINRNIKQLRCFILVCCG
jgi:hypothetical protein